MNSLFAAVQSKELLIILLASIFFLPLNFLAGVYGMNFEYMPELKHPQGYTSVLMLMGAISIAIFIWMHKKGWMKNPDE